jgi:hypothetical protein
MTTVDEATEAVRHLLKLKEEANVKPSPSI